MLRLVVDWGGSEQPRPTWRRPPILEQRMSNKKWWQSKTMWANALVLLNWIAKERFGIGMEVPPEAVGIAVGNMILRSLTSKPLGL